MARLYQELDIEKNSESSLIDLVSGYVDAFSEFSEW